MVNRKYWLIFSSLPCYLWGSSISNNKRNEIKLKGTFCSKPRWRNHQTLYLYCNAYKRLYQTTDFYYPFLLFMLFLALISIYQSGILFKIRNGEWLGHQFSDFLFVLYFFYYLLWLKFSEPFYFAFGLHFTYHIYGGLLFRNASNEWDLMFG